MDVLVSNEDVSVFGGPTSINVSVGTGKQGSRGTYIYSYAGKPTSPGAITNAFNDHVTSSAKVPQLKDLYINLEPTDNEYLYLYQYDINPLSTTGAAEWIKTLRLVPNTAIANFPVLFFNGHARTYVPANGIELSALDISGVIPSPTAPSSPSNGTMWLDVSNDASYVLKKYVTNAWVIQGSLNIGVYFPLSRYFNLDQLVPPTGVELKDIFNIQYTIINSDGKPTSSNIAPQTTYSDSNGMFLPILVDAIEATTNPSTGVVTWGALTDLTYGTKVHVIITAGVGA